ncbi:hypothetical protein HK099_003911 [Clydaea vesicula]|uniref:C2H2-type domain-containing protein n=1 Tax=Clydaea vesicula TaxID=447962 RepID=A0AAD5U113_9FUNG|nr:hypothetical protein HK099_003911 [Clydaea vesicula]
MFTQIDSYISQQSTPPQQTGNNINSSQPIPIKFDQNIHSPPHPIPIKFEQNSSSSQQVSFKFNHGQSPQHVPFKFEQSHSSSFNYKHSSLQGSSPPHSPQQMSINTSITSVPAHLNIPQQAIYPSPNSANSIKLSPIVPVASNYVSAHLPSSQTISTIPLHTNFSNNNDNSNLAEQKVVVCDYFGCGKTFTQLKNLKSHKRCHSEKSFECEQCGVKFKRLPDMYRHRRSVHDGGKPHRCEVCGKTFARADGLKNHQLTKGAAKKCANNKNNMKSLLSPY